MLALYTLAAGAPVTSLPGLTEPICWKHEAGYLPVKNGAKQLFYWYHEATESPESKPWLLWLNGGPGCSSLGGLLNTDRLPSMVSSSGSLPWRESDHAARGARRGGGRARQACHGRRHEWGPPRGFGGRV